MRKGRLLPLIVVAAMMATAACGGDDGSAGPGAAGSREGRATEASFGPWSANDPADAAQPWVAVDVQQAAEGGLAEEDRVEGEGAFDVEASIDGADPVAATDGSPEPVPERDPCAVLSKAGWQSWSASDGGEEPVALEDSTVCGWKDSDDRRRVAIGVFEVAAEARWLGTDDAGGGVRVAGVGDQATWLEGWPVAQSSTLVVEAGKLDVVIELSARDGTTQAALRERAIGFANLALDGLA